MDKYVKELNKIGFQPVFLPDPSLDPVTLYVSDGEKLVIRGDFLRYLPTSDTSEFTFIEAPRPDIAALSTSRKNISGSLSFLKNALGVIGLNSIPKLDLGFMKGSSVSFYFKGVWSKTVRPADIDSVIDRFEPKGIPLSSIEGDKLHLAFEYLYAEELCIAASEKFSFDASVGMDVSAYIDVGAEAELSVEGDRTITISSNTIKKAAFAYRAGRLISREGRWEFYPGDVVLGSGSQGEPELTPYLPLRGQVARVTMD